MNGCGKFLSELDRLGVDAVSQEHPRACARCARALAAAREIEALLGPVPAAAAPEGFTARVMERVRATAPAFVPAGVPAGAPAFGDPLPVWVRLAAEPRVAGALVIAALLVSQAARLLAFGRAGLMALAARLAAGGAGWDASPLARTLAAALPDGEVRLAVLCSLLTLIALLAVPLYRWSEHFADPHGR